MISLLVSLLIASLILIHIYFQIDRNQSIQYYKKHPQFQNFLNFDF